ncbi:hypothetical protein VCHA41O245_10172 [Vibrio chagasii]|nr:hypothetical protein VCHA41O245_10172 [Vibrio chagasii]
MKKILVVLAMIVVTGCGGSDGSSKPKEKPIDNKNALKVVKLTSNVDKNSVFTDDYMGHHSLASSIDSIDSKRTKIFDDMNNYVRSVNIVSNNILLTSSYDYSDDKYRNMITYINDGNHLTYELEMDSLLVEHYRAEVVGDVVVILTDDDFYYIEDGQRHSIKSEDIPNDYRTDGKYIAYFTNFSELNVITLDGKVKTKTNVKDADLLAVDEGNVILAMRDDFKCHPIDYGVQSDLYGNYILKNCDLYDASANEGNTYSQLYYMRPIVRFNIDTEELEPWVWITVFSETSSNGIDYHKGHIFFNEIIQDIRTQSAAKYSIFKEYRGKNIPLVGMSNYCSGVEEDYIYASDPVGIIQRDDNNIYCFENTYVKKNGKTESDGIKFTINYINNDGDYVNDGYRMLSTKKYNIVQTNSAHSFMVSNKVFTFSHDKNRFTFNPETNVMNKSDSDNGIVFIKPMQRSNTINQYDYLDGRPKRKRPF